MGLARGLLIRVGSEGVGLALDDVRIPAEQIANRMQERLALAAQGSELHAVLDQARLEFN